MEIEACPPSRLPPPYSSEIQQPMRTTATLGRRSHTYRVAPVDRDQDRARSCIQVAWPGWPLFGRQRTLNAAT